MAENTELTDEQELEQMRIKADKVATEDNLTQLLAIRSAIENIAEKPDFINLAKFTKYFI